MLNEEIFEVTPEIQGLRLDKWAAQQFNEFSRSYLAEQIKNGQILINGQQENPNYKLRLNDRINVQLESLEQEQESNLEPQEGPLPIAYQHKHFLVIDKPAGLVVHPGAGVPNGTLANFLAWHFPQVLSLPNWGLIHRLDKDTSGLMVIALTQEGYHELTQQMLVRNIHRVYHALIIGNLRFGQIIHTKMSRDPHNRLKRAVTHAPLAKEAITHVKVLQRFEKTTLVECTLETGRTHQIRVHLEYIRHPIIGEPLYSGSYPTKKLFHRQALHATKLRFDNPWDDNVIDLHSPVPADMAELIATQKPSSLGMNDDY